MDVRTTFETPDRRIDCENTTLRDIVRANNDIAPVRSHAASMHISGHGFAHIYQARHAQGQKRVYRSRLERKRQKRTESVLLILASRTESETAIVLAHAAVDAITKTLVEINRNRVCAADVEVDKEAAVDVVRRGLEEVHEDARERETAVFGRDGQCGDVTVKVMRGPFSLAQDWPTDHEMR
jgi:hypothetical protein